MIRNLEDYSFIRPANPPNNANQFEIESWKKKTIKPSSMQLIWIDCSWISRFNDGC
jgi:hypothetical protein